MELVSHRKQHCFNGVGVLLGANVVDANEVLTSDLFQGRLQQIQPHLQRAERYFRVNIKENWHHLAEVGSKW